MHSYSLDTPIRRKIHVFLALIAMVIPAFIENARTFFGISPQYGFPVTFSAVYGVLFYLMDKWFWRWCSEQIGIPNLNGRWEAIGKSSYKDPDTGENKEFNMEITIKQTFSVMEVFTKTGDSTSRSTMASICTQHAVPIFRYTYENEPKSLADDELQRHPGLATLRIDTKTRLTGDYFSGKHRLCFGELMIEKV